MNGYKGIRWLLAAAAALVGAPGCGQGDVGEPVERVSTPIIAGTTNTGDPAIIELLALHSPSRAGLCTATLVSPRVLLTAAHCVAENPSALYGVFFGANNEQLNADTFVPAQAAIFNPKYSLDNPALEHDIAVVVLPNPAPMAPLPMNRQALGAEVVGKPVRYVGYGLSDGVNRTGSGIKREATQPIAEVRRTFIRVAPNEHGACNGDSGGPLLMKRPDGSEAIVGVVSFGDDEHCLQNTYFQRLDTQIAWVDEQIAKYDPTAVAGGSVQGVPTAPSLDEGLTPAAPTPAEPAPAPAVEAPATPSPEREPTPAPAPGTAPPPVATAPGASAVGAGTPAPAPDEGTGLGPAAGVPSSTAPPSALVPGDVEGGCRYGGSGPQSESAPALLITLLGAALLRRRRRAR